MVLIQNKQTRYKHAVAAVSRKHHFSNANTFEIVFTLLFLAIVTRVLSFLSREARY